MPQPPSELIRLALDAASFESSEDLPIAAIVTDGSGSVISSFRNAVVQDELHTAHAEMLAIAGISRRTLRSEGEHMTIAVTLEPCPMCAWAIRSAGIGRLVFGAYNQLYGAAGSVFDLLRDHRFGPKVEVIGGVLEKECQQLLGNAFLEIRNNRAR